jgi:hypothetical protein
MSANTSQMGLSTGRIRERMDLSRQVIAPPRRIWIEGLIVRPDRRLVECVPGSAGRHL